MILTRPEDVVEYDTLIRQRDALKTALENMVRDYDDAARGFDPSLQETLETLQGARAALSLPNPSEGHAS